MKTAEIINIVCSDLGIAKADLAKRMGMIPSSLYRKLARESMTLRELQECLDVLGVEMEINLRYPDDNARSSQVNQELLISRLQREKRTLWHMWIREENHFTDFFFISRNGRWDLKFKPSPKVLKIGGFRHIVLLVTRFVTQLNIL